MDTCTAKEKPDRNHDVVRSVFWDEGGAYHPTHSSRNIFTGTLNQYLRTRDLPQGIRLSLRDREHKRQNNQVAGLSVTPTWAGKYPRILPFSSGSWKGAIPQQ